ncbi:MAG: recombinase family protein [Thalassovita sp.]
MDRLGRNYQNVTDTIRHFMRQGVVVKTVINGMTFDGATQDPMQEAVRTLIAPSWQRQHRHRRKPRRGRRRA